MTDKLILITKSGISDLENVTNVEIIETASEIKIVFRGTPPFTWRVRRTPAERERLLATIADARTVIERGVELMSTEQLNEWSGVRSWLEQAPYDDGRKDGER